MVAQWLASRGKTWEELYTGPSTGYVKQGIPAEYHQTTWCAEKTMDFIDENNGKPWMLTVRQW